MKFSKPVSNEISDILSEDTDLVYDTRRTAFLEGFGGLCLYHMNTSDMDSPECIATVIESTIMSATTDKRFFELTKLIYAKYYDEIFVFYGPEQNILDVLNMIKVHS